MVAMFWGLVLLLFLLYVFAGSSDISDNYILVGQNSLAGVWVPLVSTGLTRCSGTVSFPVIKRTGILLDFQVRSLAAVYRVHNCTLSIYTYIYNIYNHIYIYRVI